MMRTLHKHAREDPKFVIYIPLNWAVKAQELAAV